MILIAIALLLGGFVLIQESQRARQGEMANETDQPLFNFKEGDIQAFTLKTSEQTLSFVKGPAATPRPKPSPQPTGGNTPGPSPSASEAPQVWRMTSPQTTLANDGSVAFLLNLIATSRSPKRFTVPANQQAEFGLDQPLATIDVTLKDQKKHRLVLGNPDFNRTYLYAQVDPPTPPGQEITVHLVPLDFENAVQRSRSEWQNQPQPSPPKASPRP